MPQSWDELDSCKPMSLKNSLWIIRHHGISTGMSQKKHNNATCYWEAATVQKAMLVVSSFHFCYCDKNIPTKCNLEKGLCFLSHNGRLQFIIWENLKQDSLKTTVYITFTPKSRKNECIHAYRCSASSLLCTVQDFLLGNGTTRDGQGLTTWIKKTTLPTHVL